MLDDLKYIHEKDSADSIGAAAKMYKPLSAKLVISGSMNFKGVSNIVYSAMGDSSLAAMVLNIYPATGVPLEIVRGYNLPAYAGKNSLVILASNSGNTEETLSIYSQSQSIDCPIVVITGGGRLLELAKQNNNAYVEIPKDIHPRYSGLYTYRALLDILNKLKLVRPNDPSETSESRLAFLNNSVKSWLPDKATSANAAKQMALELMGRPVVIYSGPELFPAAYKWKLGINQNAKQLAWANQLPEYNHNELTGWSKQPIEKPFVVIELKSSFDHARVIKRFEVGSKLTSGLRPEALIVQAEGESVFQQLIYCMVLGEFVSIYLALLNGLDPTPLKLVEKFKQAMGPVEAQ